MITWKEELEHLEMLESQWFMKEAIEFKKNKGILELWELEEEKKENII